MRRQQAKRENDDSRRSTGSLLALGLIFGMLGFAGVFAPAVAQRSWDPVVATVPGGALQGQQQLPVMVDPQQFPPPTQAPAAIPNDPLPQGAWSPLVTGAIPIQRTSQSRTRTAPTGATAVAQTRGSSAADGLSPVRPAPGGVVTATAQPQTGEAAVSDVREDAHSPASRPGPLDALPPNATAAQQYCFNTADTAADARFAWQAKKIQEMEAELNKRAELLAAKTEEYKTWLERRDEFSRKAHEKLVGFYSRMRADAAAAQLAAIDEETAAAVVTKLETKVASQIMGEMEPVQAAKIASVIAGAARTKPAARRGAAARAAASRSRDAAATPGNARAPRGQPES